MSLVGCSLIGNGDKKQTVAEAPVYERSISQYRLMENANSYMTDYAQEGFFYFALNEKEIEEGLEGGGESKSEYQFYYQAYDGKEVIPFGLVTDGIVRDFSSIAKDGGNRLAVLRIGEEACILEFEKAGNTCGKTVIDERFNNLEELISLLAWPDGGFVIGMADNVFFLNEDGQITKTLKLEGSVRELYVVDEKELFAVIEKNKAGGNKVYLTKLNVQKEQVEETRELQNNLMGLFVFEDGFVSVLGDRVVFLHADKEDEEVLIDLNRQSILASQIQYIFGNREEIKIVSMDQENGWYFTTLREITALGGVDNKKESGEPLYASDGRRIVRVAIPKGCLYQVEFHAKKYNQISDKVFVEVERIEDSLETFLGKGNRPDVIMFNDNTEIDAYIQKDALVDILPLFQEQETYSFDGIILKARELLGIENAEGMYAMAGKFRLLLRTSDGTEYDSNGKCDSINYLKWYDKFITENEIDGMGTLENFLYANVAAFYNENTAEAFFTSDEFKKLMQTYKDVHDRHEGNINQWPVTMEGDYKGIELARGPRWYASYSCFQLVEPDVKIEGIPGPDGKNHVYMKLEYPMSIMSTSDCKEEAFDFIMYYNSLVDVLIKGDTEAAYGKGSNTMAIFSVYEENMKEKIYESELPYYSDTMAGIDYFFTEEQNTQLKNLINSAVSDTKTQRDIYAMFMEEMDMYLKGGKDLDSVCEILQNRVELYLKEKR